MESIKLTSSLKPTLQPGSYQLTAVHKTATKAASASDVTNNPDYQQTLNFNVGGNRFHFDKSYVTSKYPGDGDTGSFNNCIPYATVLHPTITWTDFSHAPEEDKSLFDNKQSPRLGLLLLSSEDVYHEIDSMSLEDLFSTGTANQASSESESPLTPYYPLSQLLHGEDPKQKVKVLEIPYELFCHVAPSKENIDYLAHVREITGPNNEVSKVSVITSPRLPSGKCQYNAYLVSLDGYLNFLPSNTDSNQPLGDTNPPDKSNTLRCVVFKSWTFFTSERDQNFANVCENLNTGFTSPIALQFPYKAPAQSQSEHLEDTDPLENTFKLGYVAMQHHLREGGETVSFYRGPLATATFPLDASIDPSVPAKEPDKLLRYNPNTGVFDASYAAAWQAGQMVSLSNKEVAAAQWQIAETARQTRAIKAQRKMIIDKLELSITPKERTAPHVKKKSIDWLVEFSQKRRKSL